MKLKLFCACALMAIATASCNDADMDNDADKADTAVLVEDPQNTLNANPVNDSTVIITDSTHIH